MILEHGKKPPIYGDTAVDTEPSVAILVSATPVNAIDLACYEWSSPMYHAAYGKMYNVVYGMRTIHRISWRYVRIPSAGNSSALWTHGKQRLHFPSSGVFHAVSSLPMSSSSLITSKSSEISNMKISAGAAFNPLLSLIPWKSSSLTDYCASLCPE